MFSIILSRKRVSTEDKREASIKVGRESATNHFKEKKKKKRTN